jgi:hypothetical protein
MSCDKRDCRNPKHDLCGNCANDGGDYLNDPASACYQCLKGTCRFVSKDAAVATERRPSLPDDASKRLEYPMADGLLDYFPNALAEVARLSHVATQQHHPDQPMHWDRSKSTDHRNKIMRHLVDTGLRDDKGMRHSAMVAWRALALLQDEIEKDEGLPPSRASKNHPGN